MDTFCNSCRSCGMSLATAADYALGDPAQEYCSYCTDEVGRLKSCVQVLESMTDYVVSPQGIDRSAAITIAEQTLKACLAWQSEK